MTIANSIDREQATRLVDLAWKEYADDIGQPARQTPELRQAMLWLAWQACRIEREAQEEARKAAIEEEREACKKIIEEKMREYRAGDKSAMVCFQEALYQIRARSELIT